MNDNERIMRDIGIASRNLQSWLLKQRRTHKQPAEALSGAWGVELVARTFNAGPEEARTILQEILQLPAENFPITPLLRLTAHLDQIWPCDPAFAAAVYVAVFGFEELSDDWTRVGGPIMPLTTSRRDDYSLCRFQLQNHLAAFLRAEPLLATRTVLGILNGLVSHNHVEPFLLPGVAGEGLKQHFRFRGGTAIYSADGSYMWDEFEFPDDAKSLANELTKLVTELATDQRLVELDELLDVWRDVAQSAILWRRLLQCATQNPVVFAPRLYDLCSAYPVLAGNDTVREVGNFISVAVPYWDDHHCKELELSILALGDADAEEIPTEIREGRRDRLLECLPQDRLQTVAARTIRGRLIDEERLPQNEPLVTVSYEEGPDILAMVLDAERVEIPTLQDELLWEWLGELSAFATDWQNKRPPEADVEAILQTAEQTLEALSNRAIDEKVYGTSRLTVATCVAAMSRGVRNSESKAFAFCSQFLLSCAYAVAQDSDQETTAQPWSQSLQTEAANGLAWLIRLRPEAELLNAFTSLATSPGLNVRYRAVSELFRLIDITPEYFWALCKRIARDERDAMVQSALCNTVSRAIVRDVARGSEVMSELTLHVQLNNNGSQLGEMLSVLAVQWSFSRDNTWARSFLSNLLLEPIQYAIVLKHAVHQALNLAKPRALADEQCRAVAERSITWLAEAMDAAIKGFRELCAKREGYWTEDEGTQAKYVYQVIDHILLRLYTSAEISDQFQEQGAISLTHEERKRYFERIEPLLQQALEFLEDAEHGVITASTAHHLMQLLAGVVSYHPARVLKMAHRIATAAETSGYTLDPMAIREVVHLVETILASHTSAAREGEALQDLLGLLNCFAKTGSPDALRLMWRLDELFK